MEVSMNDTDPQPAGNTKQAWLQKLGVNVGAGQPAAAPSGPPSAPPPSGLGMRARGGLPRLDPDAAERIVGSDSDAPRDQVERKLTEFLQELAKSQKSTTIKASGRAQVAEFTLRKGVGGQPYVKDGDTKDYEPDDLASKIAKNLPDKIPGANFVAFLKMKPVEDKKAGSVTDKLHEKYLEKRDELVKKLPKSLQEAARKAIDAAVEKGIPFVADKVLSGVGGNLKDDVQQFVDQYTKKVTGNADDNSE
jgi:hypothetical protein